ncbi:MAG: hypothetical protein HY303_17370, partial [Candidatus Wallbacteria bacterium]|nr:hypothetical protein [Candidatus Wallbacteria bacterium]
MKLPERTRGALVFEIYAERAAASADGVIELAGPAFPGAERESGFLALSPEPGTDAEMLQERGGRGIDVHELPDFAAPWASPELVLVRSFERPGYVFLAKATRRTRLDVAQLEATAAEASTLVADTGQTLTSITYQIRNTREQFLRLELPPEATLESVTVSGKPVKPAEGTGKTQRMIPLSPSRKTKQGLEAVAVAVVYSAPSGPLDRWGSWKAEVPR